MSVNKWDFVGLAFPAWVDMPSIEEIQAAPYMGNLGCKLRLRLEEYHRMPKYDQAQLEGRRGLLTEMQVCLRSLETPPALKSWFSWLAELATGKAQYLSCLEIIFSQGWHEEERLDSYLNGHSTLKDSRWQALTLTKSRYLMPERAVFWGNYMMECLDPCHRQQPELYRVWERQRSGQLPYLLWLEEYGTVQHKHWVRYMTPLEQEAQQIFCQDGRLLSRKGRPLSCPERQHFIFVIDLEQRIYASRADPHLCHASFTRGQPVLASGILQAREGLVNHLKFESGHYLSEPRHWWQAIQILSELGLNWGETLRMTVFDRYRYISTRLSTQALAQQDKFLAALGIASTKERANSTPILGH